MKILFLTNLMPYPLDNGGKIKTYTTLQGLSKAGHSVDLVCFTECKKDTNVVPGEVAELCDKVEQVFQRLTTAENKRYMLYKAIISLFSRYSFGLYKYKSSKMVLGLKQLSVNTQYDCIYYDHLQSCVYKPYLDSIFPKCKTILDEHNCETLIVSRNAENSSNIIKKIFLWLEAYKLSRFEAKCLSSVDVSIVLSREDYIQLSKLCKQDFPHEIIPIGIQDRGIKKYEPIVEKHLNILFIGTLTWKPNDVGMQWFLKEVIPLLDKCDFHYTLYIVGKNPSKELIGMTGSNENIIVTGYVDSVDEYYDKCHCMIVPLFIGSGQRVKIIEAFSKGMPVISTSIGAEGLMYKKDCNIMIADTALEFQQSIEMVSDSKIWSNLSRNSRIVYEENYSPEGIQRKVLDVIMNV